MIETAGLVPFKALDDVEAICFYLGCTPATLQEISVVADFVRPKTIKRRKSSRPREVFLVEEPLRRIHRQLGLSLDRELSPWPDEVQGFTRNRSILSNAERHARGTARRLMTFDLKDFFDHITLQHVVRVFEAVGTPRMGALALARLCTYHDKLLQGSRASPTIANAAAASLDVRLKNLHDRIMYTRYADDIAISGNCLPSWDEIQSAVEQEGFQVNMDTCREFSVNSGRVVTGVSITANRPRLSRRQRSKLEWEVKHAVWKRAEGLVASARQLEPRLCRRWRRLLSARSEI